MMRRATKTPAVSGGGLAPTMRELEEIVERINALLRRMCECEEKEAQELSALFARYAEEQRRQG